MSPKRRISNTEVIVIEKEIKVVGLSLEKSGLPKTFESLGELWGIYSDEHRQKTGNIVVPIVEYGFWYSNSESYDYVVGSAVSDFENINDELAAFTIPAGKYIKDSFNAFDFEELVTETFGKRNVKKWAEENNIKIKESFGIEVYPV